jgi:purine-binding chemotaxis protein CheW
MNGTSHYVVFSLDDQKFALPLASVEKIARAVDVRPLPGVSDVVLGIINMEGRIIPVVSLRKRFRLPERPVDVVDHMIIGRTPNHTLALLVDTVMDIVEIDTRDVIDQKAILDDMEFVGGALKLENGIVLIYDLDSVLSLEESKQLDHALAKNEKRLKKKLTDDRTNLDGT